jgi:hypothetical protein
MATPEDFAALNRRVDRLETGLAEVRTRAESAETLARLNDRDTSEIKASHAAILRSLEALRLTQVEQGRVQDHHSEVLEDHTQQLADLRTRIGVVNDGVIKIIGLLADRAS